MDEKLKNFSAKLHAMADAVEDHVPKLTDALRKLAGHMYDEASLRRSVVPMDAKELAAEKFVAEQRWRVSSSEQLDWDADFSETYEQEYRRLQREANKKTEPVQ